MTKGQTWTADAIDQDLVVQYDPTSGVLQGIDQIRRGFVKRDEIAWVGTHRHGRDGNQPHIASYIFAYAIDSPEARVTCNRRKMIASGHGHYRGARAISSLAGGEFVRFGSIEQVGWKINS